MRRREFISLLGAAAVAWPLAARAQRNERMRRIGVLLPATADDAAFQARIGAFLQELALLDWTIGRNVRIDVRWASTNANAIRRHAAELVSLTPDVILAAGDLTMPALLQATRTIPIVFPIVVDPLANGYVDSLARPGGNATGVMIADYSMSGKWLDLLKEIAPDVTRTAVIRDVTNQSGVAQFGVIQAMASSLRVEVSTRSTRVMLMRLSATSPPSRAPRREV
jgi:putative ABC transport system substrate-binding protein